jgi:phosphatidylserine/phosphatidylglycerophosphate/cardiolipin synthase-like enzyme
MNADSAAAADRIVVDPAERLPAILEVIDSSRERLDLSVFRCDEEAVLDALERAVRRGVRVRALVTGRAKGSKALLKHLRRTLTVMGVDVRRYADIVVRYHAKYIVADNGPAIVASLNFTRKCFGPTCDFILVSTEPELVAALRRVFDADWQGPGHPPPDGQTGRLIVGPEHARVRFAALIGQAAHRIRLIDPKISDPAMLLLLRKRETEGIRVDVRGRSGLGPLTAHGKLIMIDEDAAAIGSISLSTLALEFRRELAVVIRDRSSLDALNTFWDSLPAIDAPGPWSGIQMECP